MTNQEIIDYIKRDYPTQTDVYYWSTFILPDGTFVIPENDDDDYLDDMYEHANIIDGVADNCFEGSFSQAESWLEDNCVKCNATYPYIVYPFNITNKQFWAAEDYLETIIVHPDGFEGVGDYPEAKDMKLPVQIIIDHRDSNIYDLSVHSPQEITKIVKKGRTRGMLESMQDNKKYFTIVGKDGDKAIYIKSLAKGFRVLSTSKPSDTWLSMGRWDLTLNSHSSNNPQDWTYELPYKLVDGGGYLIAKADSLDEIKQYYINKGYEFVEDSKINTIKESLERVMKFTVVAYNKDADTYVDLFTTEDVHEAIVEAEKNAYLCLRDRLRDKDGEPFDWIEVVDERDKVYWASYDDFVPEVGAILTRERFDALVSNGDKTGHLATPSHNFIYYPDRGIVVTDRANPKKSTTIHIDDVKKGYDHIRDIDADKVLTESFRKGLNEGPGSGDRRTTAQRYNDRADKIFQGKKNLDRAQAEYLRRLGVSEEEITQLTNDDKLQLKLIELGEKDNFYSKYDFKSGVLKESYNENSPKVKLAINNFDSYEGGDTASYTVDNIDTIKPYIIDNGYKTTFKFSDDLYQIKQDDIKKVEVVAMTQDDIYRTDVDVQVYIDIDDNMDLIYCGTYTNSNDVKDVAMVEKIVNDWMRTGKTVKTIKEDFMMEDTMKKDYNKLFSEFLDLIEFQLVENGDDSYTDANGDEHYGKWSLIDLQGGNIGGIEARRYTNATDMIEDLDIYIDDYIFNSIIDSLKDAGIQSSYSDYRILRYRDELPDSEWDFDVLDMIANHADEIDLEKVEHNGFLPVKESLKEDNRIPRNATKVRGVKTYGDDKGQSIEFIRDGSIWRGKDFITDSRTLRKHYSDFEVVETDPNYKPKRTEEVYVIQGNYGNGWDDLTQSSSYKEAKADLKSYDENESYPHRLITRRVPVEESLKEQYWIDDKEVMAEVNRLSKDLESKGYEYANRPLHSGSMYYDFYFKKIGDNEFDCKAIKYNYGTVEVIDVDVEQMMGREPIDDFDRMRTGIGRKLFGESKKENGTRRIKPASKNIETDVYEDFDQEQDTAWTKDEICAEIKSLTSNFTAKSGEAKTFFDEEKDFAVACLEENGYTVTADRQGGKWVIVYKKQVKEHVAVDRYDQLNKDNAKGVIQINATPSGKVLKENAEDYKTTLLADTKKAVERDKKLLDVARREAANDPKHKAYYDKMIADLESHIAYNEERIEKLSKEETKVDFADSMNSRTFDSAMSYRDSENRKALENADKVKPDIIRKGQPGYDNLEYAAMIATEKSPRGFTYTLGDTYLDFGSGWQWTTLIADKNNGRDSYQALNQVEWEEITNAESNEVIDRVIDNMFKDQYCPDRISRRVESVEDALLRLDMID